MDYVATLGLLAPCGSIQKTAIFNLIAGRTATFAIETVRSEHLVFGRIQSVLKRFAIAESCCWLSCRGGILPDFDFQFQIDSELFGDLGPGQVDQALHIV